MVDISSMLDNIDKNYERGLITEKERDEAIDRLIESTQED